VPWKVCDNFEELLTERIYFTYIFLLSHVCECTFQLLVAKRIYLTHFFQVCIEDTLPTAICQLCCDRLEEFHSFVLKVEEVQQNIHRMLSSQSYGTSNCVSHILDHRKFQSDQIGDISVKADMNKSVNNLEVSRDVPPCSQNFRNDSEITTSNNVAQACVIKSSPNCLSHLQEQCFVPTDNETNGINETDVEYIKVEADPLQIENDDTGSAEDSVHVFSDTITYESSTSKLLYRLLTGDKRCDYSQDARAVSTACDTPSEIVHYRNNKKVADKTLIPIDNLRNKCHRNSVSKAGESDVEKVQVRTAAKIQGSIRNTAASSEPGSQRYLCFYVDKHLICNWSTLLYISLNAYIHWPDLKQILEAPSTQA